MDQPNAFNKKILYFCFKTKNSKKKFISCSDLVLSIKEPASLYFLHFRIIFSIPTSLCLSYSGRFLYHSRPYFTFCFFLLLKDFDTFHEHFLFFILKPFFDFLIIFF